MRGENETGHEQNRGDNERSDYFHKMPPLSKCTAPANLSAEVLSGSGPVFRAREQAPRPTYSYYRL
jgi:hypothetical protein